MMKRLFLWAAGLAAVLCPGSAVMAQSVRGALQATGQQLGRSAAQTAGNAVNNRINSQVYGNAGSNLGVQASGNAGNNLGVQRFDQPLGSTQLRTRAGYQPDYNGGQNGNGWQRGGVARADGYSQWQGQSQPYYGQHRQDNYSYGYNQPSYGVQQVQHHQPLGVSSSQGYSQPSSYGQGCGSTSAQGQIYTLQYDASGREYINVKGETIYFEGSTSQTDQTTDQGAQRDGQPKSHSAGYNRYDEMDDQAPPSGDQADRDAQANRDEGNAEPEPADSTTAIDDAQQADAALDAEAELDADTDADAVVDAPTLDAESNVEAEVDAEIK